MSPKGRVRSPPPAGTKEKGSGSGSKTPQSTPSSSRSRSRRSRTRDARRSRTRRPHEVVIECVIRETNGSSNWPQLTKTNYDSWSLLMKLKLQARHLWDIIESGDGKFHDDRTALKAICSGVPPEMVPTLATKRSAKEAWEVIRSMHIGDERMRKSTTQSLHAEYEQITFRDGESVEDFALRLSNIVQRLAIISDPEPQPKVVAKYLLVVRPRYKHLVISIETLLDIDTLSVEEVTGRLKATTEDEPSLAQDVAVKLLLTKEQWLERYKKRDKDSGRGGSSSVGRGKRRGRSRGRGTGSDSDSRASSNWGQTIPDNECKAYGKKGHWAKDCRSKKRVEQAHVA
ncbi:uncharacterized protein [Miscanthus floridulus]|uniref:uncharacterized protein n=1 Tax=Miscanthus floridulus TaxID=154761 RepID=UPI00345955CF